MVSHNVGLGITFKQPVMSEIRRIDGAELPDSIPVKFAENAVMVQFESDQVGEKTRLELLKNIPY